MASNVLPMGTMLVGFMGAISSSVPAIAILTSSSLRSRPMFQTIVNLALSETWFLFCGGVLGTTNVVGVKMTPTACAAFQSHNVSVGIGSTTALLVVCVERLVAVVHGLRYETLLSPRRMRLLLVSPWLVMGVSWAIFTSLSSAMILQNFGPSPLHCRFLEVMPPALKLAATGTAMVVCAVIAVLNVIISRVAVRHQRAIRQQRHMVGLATKETVNAYWGVLRVTVIYILFQTPANLLFLLELLWKPQPPGLIAISSVLVVFIYTIDGWFFGFYNAQLRRRYAQMFGCWSPEREELVREEREVPRGGDDSAGVGDSAGVVHVVPQPWGGNVRRARTARVTPGSPARLAEHAEAGGATTPIWLVPQVPVHIVAEEVPQVTVAAEVSLQAPVQIVGEEQTRGARSAGPPDEAAPTLAPAPQLNTCRAEGMRDWWRTRRSL